MTVFQIYSSLCKNLPCLIVLNQSESLFLRFWVTLIEFAKYKGFFSDENQVVFGFCLLSFIPLKLMLSLIRLSLFFSLRDQPTPQFFFYTPPQPEKLFELLRCDWLESFSSAKPIPFPVNLQIFPLEFFLIFWKVCFQLMTAYWNFFKLPSTFYPARQSLVIFLSVFILKK